MLKVTHPISTNRMLVGVVAFVVSLFAHVASADAQASPARELAPTDLLVAVLAFRYTVVESSTPVIACTVVKLMDTPRDFPHAFPIVVQNIFDRRSFPCEPVERPTIPYDSTRPLDMRTLSMMPKDPGCVWLDSVRRVDSLATVRISVKRHGDALHHEEFKAVFQAAHKRWLVTEARLFGLLFAHGPGGC